MRFHVKLAALLTLILLPLSAAASEWPDGRARPQGTAEFSQPIMGYDGSAQRAVRTDASGQVLTKPDAQPIFEVIQHKSNITVASAAFDSSQVPFDVSKYSRIYALVRIKAASLGAAANVCLSVRCVLAAQTDSTALGWNFPLGKQFRQGKTIGLLSQDGRWQMIPLADSLTNAPFQAPYMTACLQNLTGAQVIEDLWFLGVR